MCCSTEPKQRSLNTPGEWPAYDCTHTTPPAPPPEEQFNVDPEQISRLKLNSVIAVMGLHKTEEGSPQG